MHLRDWLSVAVRGDLKMATSIQWPWIKVMKLWAQKNIRPAVGRGLRGATPPQEILEFFAYKGCIVMHILNRKI